MQFCLSFGQLLNFHPKIWTRGRSKYDIPSGPWLLCEFSPHNTFFCPLMVSLTWLETIGSRVTWPDKRLETCSFPSLPRILKISNQPSPLVKSFTPYWKWKHFPQHFATSGDERGAFLSVYVEWLPPPPPLPLLPRNPLTLSPSLSLLSFLFLIVMLWGLCNHNEHGYGYDEKCDDNNAEKRQILSTTTTS